MAFRGKFTRRNRYLGVIKVDTGQVVAEATGEVKTARQEKGQG